jgi:hypothetical protein
MSQPYPAQPEHAGPSSYPGSAPSQWQQPGQLPQYPGHAYASACRMCGSVPAAKVKFRGHQGFVIVMRFLSVDGPFCRDCGLATFRSMTSKSLVQGWYGYASFIITPIIVLVNLSRHGTVAALPAPQPNPYGPSRHPMDPGPRLLERPMTWIGLCIPLVVVALFVLIAARA